MNKQIHVRVSKEMLSLAKDISESQGYSSEQEYFRTALREKVEEDLKKKVIYELLNLKGSVKDIRKLTKEDKERIARSL